MEPVTSVFRVTHYVTKEVTVEKVVGCGQETVRNLRKRGHRNSRIVLIGFEVGGKKIPLRIE